MTKKELTQKLNELADRHGMSVSDSEIGIMISYMDLMGALNVQPERPRAPIASDFFIGRFMEVK